MGVPPVYLCHGLALEECHNRYGGSPPSGRNIEHGRNQKDVAGLGYPVTMMARIQTLICMLALSIAGVVYQSINGGIDIKESSGTAILMLVGLSSHQKAWERPCLKPDCGSSKKRSVRI